MGQSVVDPMRAYTLQHTHTHTCRETITSHAIVGEPLTELIPNYEEH